MKREERHGFCIPCGREVTVRQQGHPRTVLDRALGRNKVLSVTYCTVCGTATLVRGLATLAPLLSSRSAGTIESP